MQTGEDTSGQNKPLSSSRFKISAVIPCLLCLIFAHSFRFMWRFCLLFASDQVIFVSFLFISSRLCSLKIGLRAYTTNYTKVFWQLHQRKHTNADSKHLKRLHLRWSKFVVRRFVQSRALRARCVFVVIFFAYFGEFITFISRLHISARSQREHNKWKISACISFFARPPQGLSRQTYFICIIWTVIIIITHIEFNLYIPHKAPSYNKTKGIITMCTVLFRLLLSRTRNNKLIEGKEKTARTNTRPKLREGEKQTQCFYERLIGRFRAEKNRPNAKLIFFCLAFVEMQQKKKRQN